MKKKVIGIFLLAVMAATVLTGCVPSVKANAQTMNVATQQTGTRSRQEVEAAAMDIMNKMFTYAGNDYDAFTDLYTETPEEIIQSDYNADYSDFTQKDQHFVTLVCSKDDYYRVDYTAAICAGFYPDYRTNYMSSGLVLKDTEEGWKIDFGNTAVEQINSAYMDTYPDGLLDAYNAGRNASEFDSYIHWNYNPQNVVKGDLAVKLKYMWQDENMDLHLVLLYANGTGANRSVYNTKVTVTDDTLGTVFDGYVDDFVIMNGSNALREYVIPGDQVLTGTQTWGNMSSHVHDNTK